LIIALVITPLAKTLSIVDRGGGLAFGLMSSLVGICLIVGIFSPFLTTTGSGIFAVNTSFLFPWLIQGYNLLLAGISVFAGDILTNPLESFPLFRQTPV
jgi:hypothetical protein